MPSLETPPRVRKVRRTESGRGGATDSHGLVSSSGATDTERRYETALKRERNCSRLRQRYRTKHGRPASPCAGYFIPGAVVDVWMVDSIEKQTPISSVVSRSSVRISNLRDKSPERTFQNGPHSNRQLLIAVKRYGTAQREIDTNTPVSTLNTDRVYLFKKQTKRGII